MATLWFFFLSSDYRLAGHLAEVEAVQTFAFSKGTNRNYHSIWNSYVTFCEFSVLTPFPATRLSVQSHKTVNNYISVLRQLHKLCNMDLSAFDDFRVKLTQKGLETAKQHISRRKHPITPTIPLQFKAHLNSRNSAHIACGLQC